ncbi:BTB/POZ and MATH domain-containing protein 2-like [Oryza glaberrima]|uniref:BTB domain-containing protein n=1 Tax=Oryza glaberrima TaxID=4538 RepID=I1QUN9_ORYGL|nr:BTB/POZ and MATH domain-containing protein 2-like [Oryza glaberrima]
MSSSSTSSASNNGIPSRSSSSAIVVSKVSGCHVLKIDGYSHTKEMLSQGDCSRSCTFRVGTHSWYLEYYPNGRSLHNASDHIAICLVRDDDDGGDLGYGGAAREQMTARFHLLDHHAGKPVPGHTRGVTSPLLSGKVWACSNLVTRKELEEHVLDGDCFAVRCDITIVKVPRRAAPAPAVVVDVPPAAAAAAPDLPSQMGALLLSMEGADVTLQVGGGEAETTTFAAHRCVLAARSSVFRSELFGATATSKAGSGGLVHVVDDGIGARAFEALLRFIYTDAPPELDEEDDDASSMARLLLGAADRYNVERLKMICENELCKRIDVNTVATTLALAEQHHCSSLKKACMDLVDANPRAVEAAGGFEYLSNKCPSILRELIARLADFDLKNDG